MTGITHTALWYASRATGVVTLVLLTAVVILGMLVNRQGRLPGLPRFAVTGLHRNISLLSVAFLAIHVLTAIADPYVTIGLAVTVIPFTAGYKPLWLGLGALSLDLAAALIVTSLARARMGRRAWRAIHWAAYAAWPLAVAHSLGSSADMRSGASRPGNLTCGMRQPPGQRGRGGQHAADEHHEHQAVSRVGAAADAVHDRKRPGGVAEPVDGTPGAAAHPGAGQAGQDQRGDQIQGDRPQAQPERLVGGRKREHGRSQADRDVGVGDRGHHVDRQERHRQQRDVPVQAGHREPGQAGQPSLPVDQDAEHYHGGQQQQRHHPGRPAGVPERGTAGNPRHGRRSGRWKFMPSASPAGYNASSSLPLSYL